jgi:ribonuclease HIII
MTNSFTATIDLSLAEKIQEDLLNQGFKFSTPPYTIFSAQKQGVSCTLYASGKLVVQGKEKEEFITFYLEPEILQKLSFSYPEIEVDMESRIGVDEAGKGDFFGPLCVAGIQADEEAIKSLLAIGVKDSKKMTDSAVRTMAKKIKERCPHTVITISPKKYNELYENFHNLNHLLAWGHSTVIAELIDKTSCRNVLIDQFASEHVVINALKKKNVSANLKQRTHAERDPVVAAASILARAGFLEGLERLSEKHHVTLPKGAGVPVLQMGVRLVQQHGKEILEDIAKLHFKTTLQVLSKAHLS